MSDRYDAGDAPAVDLPLALFTPAEMASADQASALLAPSFALMRAAGAAVAVMAEWMLAADYGARAATICVLCGPGNNGGDGWIAAERLSVYHRVIVASDFKPKCRPDSDAARAAAGWSGPMVPLAEAPLEAADLVIDALFGAGLSRPLEGTSATAVDRLNAWRRGHADENRLGRAGDGLTDHGRRRLVLSIDVPSGVDGATGALYGAVVEADATITFVRFKPGHVLMPGRLHCGDLRLADIGMPDQVVAAVATRAFLNRPALWRSLYPVPRIDGHKYGRGHVVVVSGPAFQTGAARLAARGALRAGAGLVTVAGTAAAMPILAATLTAIMTRQADDAIALRRLLADPRLNAIVIGPGLGTGDDARAIVLAALTSADSGAAPRAIVIDADALTSFSADPSDLFAAIRASGMIVVMTPHAGEFARLFGGKVDADASKLEQARDAALASGATIVFKGADTVVAGPDGRASLADSAAPWLATAGSGDVLGGIVAGLLAQGMPAFEAASAAVWLHAEAARRFGPGLIAEDLPEQLPAVIAALLGPACAFPTLDVVPAR